MIEDEMSDGKVNATLLDVSSYDRCEIYLYRQFYLIHPQIVEAVTPQLRSMVSTAACETAVAGVDNQLFVSKYQLELPKREEIEQFLAEKLLEAGDTHD